MAVDTEHPEYKIAKPEWDRVRDCQKGEGNIKARGETYLKKSAGQRAIEKNFGCEGSGPYEMYKDGARFPDWVDATVQGFTGLATRREWDIQGLPDSLSYLMEDAGNGLPLGDWQSLLITEGLEVGRYALFPDAPMEGVQGRSKIGFYQAESTINWKTDSGLPNLVTLKESVLDEGIDMFEHEYKDAYRVVVMDGGQCFVLLYDDEGDMAGDPIQLQHHEGYCPVIIGGSVNNDWTVDKPPMIGIADCSLAYYKLSAQQRWAIRATCDPMFLARGFSKNEIEIWGGGSVFEKEDYNAAIDVIEVGGTGIDKATDEMRAEMEQAEKMSHQLTDKASAEASKSLKQRTNSKTATLKSVDRCAAAALEKALNTLAKIENISAEITVTSSFDYTDEEIDATALNAISQVAERGHLPEESVVEYAQRRGMLEAYDLKEVRSMIDEDDQRRLERSAAFFDASEIDDDESGD